MILGAQRSLDFYLSLELSCGVQGMLSAISSSKLTGSVIGLGFRIADLIGFSSPFCMQELKPKTWIGSLDFTQLCAHGCVVNSGHSF